MIKNCKLIQLPQKPDPRGNLTFIEQSKHIPFDISRVYYIYDVPEGGERGGHAHKDLHQLIVALSGSFEIELDDGFDKQRVILDNPAVGLYVCPMIWRVMNKFSDNAVCLVLASNQYDESDYYRDYQNFLTAIDN